MTEIATERRVVLAPRSQGTILAESDTDRIIDARWSLDTDLGVSWRSTESGTKRGFILTVVSKTTVRAGFYTVTVFMKTMLSWRVRKKRTLGTGIFFFWLNLGESIEA
ncbi:hypothetical protein BGX28_007426 [Mortierella sp. GBA30]|nr:hypothetical protein BGX28_007426 [Mortierella sp. GBA30]